MRITYSGLYGTNSYFLYAGGALGHEGIGVVEKVGSNVTNVKVGDRVGGGYLRSVSSPIDTRLLQYHRPNFRTELR